MIEVRPVGPADWPKIVELFGARGACGGCWCMWWRVPRGGKAWEEAKGARNREAFRRLVKTGKVHAVMAFAEGEAVGWCSLGPRGSFPRLETVRALKAAPWSDQTWSIVCFYIAAAWRGRGVASRLLKAAAALAFQRGAREVQGYPVPPSRPPAKVPAAFAWTGVPAVFRSAGFVAARMPQGSRPVYVKTRMRGRRVSPSAKPAPKRNPS